MPALVVGVCYSVDVTSWLVFGGGCFWRNLGLLVFYFEVWWHLEQRCVGLRAVDGDDARAVVAVKRIGTLREHHQFEFWGLPILTDNLDRTIVPFGPHGDGDGGLQALGLDTLDGLRPERYVRHPANRFIGRTRACLYRRVMSLN
jgi:hypothetical protein